jgi:hypothetical protein
MKDFLCAVQTEAMEFEMEDILGWTVPLFLWVTDHITGVFAGILFGLQATFQIIRIYKLMKSKECRTGEK